MEKEKESFKAILFDASSRQSPGEERVVDFRSSKQEERVSGGEIGGVLLARVKHSNNKEKLENEKT